LVVGERGGAGAASYGAGACPPRPVCLSGDDLGE